MSLSNGDRYLTTVEAALYLGRGVSTLAKERMAGRGPMCVKIGRSVRYRRSDLDAFMRAHAMCGRNGMVAEHG